MRGRGAAPAAAHAMLALLACACVGSDPAPVGGGNGSTSGGSSSGANGDGSTDQPDATTTDPSSSSSSGGNADGAMSVMTLRNPAAAGHPAVGASVTIANVVVTGLKTSGSGSHGFFVQDQSAKAWAGVFVYTNTSPITVAKGDVVTVAGVYTSYRGFEELTTNGKAPVKTGTAAVPSPLVVPVLDIAEGGARAKELQSMRLRVQTVEVSRATVSVDFAVRPQGVTTGPELVITSYVINDLGPSPFTNTVGTTYSSITGFGYQFGPSDGTSIAKLAPENEGDVVE
jgi:predicted extracellular nuclease